MNLRTNKLTTKEFLELPRSDEGRIHQLPDYYFLMTECQKRKLHCDDFSYGVELDLEMECLYSEARAEFGVAA
jgi:hypothetical protein